MVKATTARIRWKRSHRLIPSQYPPIDLFEDIAPPEDWEVLARVEARTNPRIYEQIGRLELVPPERRVSGAGASWAMAPFTHLSPERPSRFSAGDYGVYYCAQALETAIRETCHSMARFMQATAEPEGSTLQMRQLVAAVDHRFHDIRQGEYADLLNPESYRQSQPFARQLRAGGSHGILYPSLRHVGGTCLAAFWPDVIGCPTQAGHWVYYWNGEQFTYVKRLDDQKETAEILRL